ncbi:MAG: DUF5676 family membrane protein [bacterium]|nr:DUF5676 family membrane protein [bacterium]
MNNLSIRKLGFAFGLTAALLYFGCALVMFIAGHDNSVIFFNSLLHGIDVSNIIRMNISLGEQLIGIVQTFIIGWLVGACVAAIYNLNFKKSQ